MAADNGRIVYSDVYLNSGTSTLVAGETASKWQITGFSAYGSHYVGTLILESGAIADGTSLGNDVWVNPELRVNAGASALNTYIGIYAVQRVSGGYALNSIVDGGAQIVSSGLAQKITISKNGQQLIRGGSAYGITISSGGWQDITEGYAQDIVILAGGSQHMTGGSASGITICKSEGIPWSGVSPDQTIEGGVAQDISILQGGIQRINGGSALDVRLDSCASQLISAGFASNVMLTGAASQVIYGGSAHDVVLTSANQCLYGGSASNTILMAGASQSIVGGVAEATTIMAGGSQAISSGSASGVIISSGGRQTILSSAFAYAVTIEAGGSQNMEGGFAQDITIGSGASQTMSGCSALNIIISGGYQGLSYAVASNVIILSGGSQSLRGGSAQDITIDRGGTQVIDFYAKVNNATILSGGLQIVLSGGIESATLSGGIQSIGLYGSGNNIDIYGGSQIVEGSVCSARVHSGGLQIMRGTASGFDIIVSSGASQILYDGAYISGLLVKPGAYHISTEKCKLEAATLEGISIVKSGASVNNTVIESDAELIIMHGGTATSSLIKSGGYEIVMGESLNASIEPGGYQTLHSGAMVKGVIVHDGGVQIISHGMAVDTFMSGGLQGVYGDSPFPESRGKATGTILTGSAAQYVEGGIVDKTRLKTGTRQTVKGSGTSATETTVEDGAVQIVLNDTFTASTVLEKGAIQYVGSSGIEGECSALYTKNYGATQFIASNGLVVSDYVYTGGQQIVDGGRTSAVTLSGGLQTLTNGATAIVGDIIGGSQIVESGAVASRISIFSSGVQTVQENGSGLDITIYNGGSQLILSGIVDNATLSGGIQSVGLYGSAANINIYGGSQIVEGSISAVTVHSGGTQLMRGTASGYNITVNSGASQILYDGAYVSGLLVKSGAYHVSTESCRLEAVQLEGISIVSTGASANGTVIEKDAAQIVMPGGVATSSLIKFGGYELVMGDSLQAKIEKGGSQIIDSGGKTSGTSLAEGALQIVSLGKATDTFMSGGVQRVYGASPLAESCGQAIGAILTGNASQYVEGGFVASTMLKSGTSQIVTGSGTSAIETTVESGAVQIVLNDTFTSETVLEKGAIQYLGSVGLDGTCSAFHTINFGAIQYIADNGFAVGDYVHADGQQMVDGGRTSDVTLSGGSQILTNGALAIAGEISGGAQIVKSNSVASRISIYESGVQTVQENGSALNITIYTGGSQLVISGAVDKVTLSGGIQSIGSSGSGKNINIYGGSQIVDGNISYVTVHSGGTQIMRGTASGHDITVSSGASQILYDGAYISGLVVKAGAYHISTEKCTLEAANFEGISIVKSGASVIRVVIASGGGQIVMHGGIASSSIIKSGGYELVMGESLKARVERGGSQIIERGGSATSATLDDGAIQIISRGKAVDTFMYGGVQRVYGDSPLAESCGEATDTVLAGSAVQYVEGGIVVSTRLKAGTSQIVKGHRTSAIETIVENSASQIVLNDTFTSKTVLERGAVQYIGSAGIQSVCSAFHTRNSGGLQIIASNGLVVSDYVYTDGQQMVAGGKTSAVTLSGGTQTLTNGATDIKGNIAGGSQIVMSDSVASRANVLANGLQIVQEKGTALNTTIFRDGVQHVESGGIARNTIVAGGGLQIVSAGYASGGSVYVGGSARALDRAEVFGLRIQGQQIVENGAIASSSIVDKGGSQIVSSGGTATYATINSGGSQIVADGEVYNTSINSGGMQIIAITEMPDINTRLARSYTIRAGRAANSGPVSLNAVINGGTQIISSGGRALRNTLNSGATQVIACDGVASDTVINSGAMQVVLSGGSTFNASVTAGGALAIASGAYVSGGSVYAGGSQLVTYGGVVVGMTIDGGAITSSGMELKEIASWVHINPVDQASSGGNTSSTTSSGGNASGGITSSGGNTSSSITSSGGNTSSTTSSGGNASGGITSSSGITSSNITSSGGSTSSTTSSGGNASGGITSSGGNTSSSITSSGGNNSSSSTSSGGNTASSGMTGSGANTSSSITSSSITNSSGGGITSPGSASQDVSWSGFVSSTILINGATQKVAAGGMAVGTIINAGTKQYVYGFSDDANIKRDGMQTIFKNGSGLNDNVYGRQIISTGGKAIGANIKYGGAQFVRGGVASGAIISKGGEQHVSANGRANGAIIQAGGRQFIYAKGTVGNIKIMAGASQILRGGSIKGTTYSAATLLVSTGIASTVRLVAGGKATIAKGGVLRNATIGAKSVLSANAGAMISQINLASGGTFKVNGAVTLYGKNTVTAATGTGAINLARGACLNIDQKVAFKGMSVNAGSGQVLVSGTGNVVKALATTKSATLGFDIGKVDAASKTVMLTGQARQNLAGAFSVATAKMQKMGVYELASKLLPARNAACAISIAGAKVGTAKVNGAALVKNGVKYTMTTKGTALNLTLSAIAGKMLKGTAKKGTLTGTANCDIFYGGTGDEIIKGVNGRDVAVYDKNAWGTDVIAATSGTMTIVITGLSKTQVIQKKSGKDMRISRKGVKNQSITVKNWNDATHSVIFGGTLGQFAKYATAKKVSTSLQNNARNEVWKKAGLLA